MPEPSQALVKQAPVTTRAVQVRETLAAVRGGYDEALFVAEKVIGRAAWPEELRKDPDGGPKAALIVMTAAELGVSPIQAFSYIAPIKGKPFLMARMVNALVSSRVPGGYITVMKRGPTQSVVRAHRAGRPDLTVEITIEMARKAGWTSNPLYEKNPAAMLVARATTTAGWLHFADVLAGMDVVDEVEGEAVTLFTASVEEVPAHALEQAAAVNAVEDDPPVEGDFREADEALPEVSESPAVADDAWFGDLPDVLKGLNKSWKDVGNALDIVIASRLDVFEWRDAHPEITDPVSFIRDALLRHIRI